MKLDVGFISTIRDNNELGMTIDEICQFQIFHRNYDELSATLCATKKQEIKDNVKKCFLIGLIDKKNGKYHLSKPLKKVKNNNPAYFWEAVNEQSKTTNRRRIMILYGKKNHKNG